MRKAAHGMRAVIWGLAFGTLAGACDEDKPSAEDSEAQSSSGGSSRSSRRSGPRRPGGEDAGSDDEPAQNTAGRTERVPVTLEFVARVGTKDFACGREYTKLGAKKSTITPRDLRLFVQDVQLIDADGKAVDVELDVRKPWQSSQVALLDFEDATGECGEGTPELNTKITGHVPDGKYTGLRFTNGVPEALNHLDPAKQEDPLKKSADLSWGWLTGFRFLKLDVVQVSSSDAPGNALLHVGATACTGNPQSGTVKCSKSNRNRIELEDFDPDDDRIVIDIAPVFAETDLTQMAECHSTGEFCAPMFEAVGLDFTSAKPREQQAVYFVE